MYHVQTHEANQERPHSQFLGATHESNSLKMEL